MLERIEHIARCAAQLLDGHGPDDKARKAKLRLDLREEAVKNREGSFAIKPGDLPNSEMIRRITAGDVFFG